MVAERQLKSRLWLPVYDVKESDSAQTDEGPLVGSIKGTHDRPGKCQHWNGVAECRRECLTAIFDREGCRYGILV